MARYDNTAGPFTISSNLKSAFIAVYCTRLSTVVLRRGGKKKSVAGYLKIKRKKEKKIREAENSTLFRENRNSVFLITRTP